MCQKPQIRFERNMSCEPSYFKLTKMEHMTMVTSWNVPTLVLFKT